MKRAVALVAPILVVLSASPAAAAPPAGRIVFERLSGSSFDVVLSDGVGGPVTPLTSGGTNLEPVWSPDGERIAFTQLVGATGYEIVVMDSDGGGVRQVTSAATSASGPTWSPDGTKIAFVDASADRAGISIVSADASSSPGAPLTAPGMHVFDRTPTWSPDGTQIAFSRLEGGESPLMVVPATGGTPVPITAPPGDDFDAHPRWSPDGSRIAYIRVTPQQARSRLAGDGAVLRVMDAGTGANDAPIAGTEKAIGGFSWSGDGTWLVFGAMPESPPMQLYAVPAAGGARVPVTTGGHQDRHASWEPLPDTDGDGLRDLWETDGLDADGDGTADLDLKAMGADPLHKDVFVELDYMAGNGIDRVATDAVVTAFQQAPVANPDGTTGINLHIDNGPASVMNPVTNAAWGALSDQESLPAQETLSGVSGVAFDWAPFDAFKDNHFLEIRRKAFHYAISGVETPASPGGRARGGAPGEPGGSDFILLIPEEYQGLDDASLRFQAGTFMHELGHNLGLKHGGSDSVARKPHYLSVMNYRYQGAWLRRGESRVLDYSRFDFPLDETTLSEQTGYGQPSAAAGFAALAFCPDGTTRLDWINALPLDWTCDGTISEPAVTVDVNGDGSRTALAGHLDWPALRFADGAIGDGAAGAASSPADDEPPASEIVAHARSLDGPVGRPLLPPPAATARPAAAPVLTALRVRPARLRPAPKGGSLVKRLPRRRGARVTFKLSAPAKVAFRIRRRTGSRWVLRPGRFSAAGRAGANTLRFSGRLRRRALASGRYRLVATPAGGRASHAGFRIR